MKFLDVVTRDEGLPTLVRLDGPIAADDDLLWGGDSAVTPNRLREALQDTEGELTVYINSPGGDVMAATEIYTMLKERKGFVTVKIDGVAASAASVIAMAGDEVLMAPSAYMMIHNASSVAVGDKREMAHEAEVLEEVDRGIRTAYKLRTGLSDRKLAEMMDAETWMSAAMAVALGFADGIIGEEEEEPDEDPEEPESDPEEEEKEETRAVAYMRRLSLTGLPAVAYSAKDARARLLQAAEHRAQEKTVAAAADAEADAIQRLKLRLLSY